MATPRFVPMTPEECETLWRKQENECAEHLASYIQNWIKWHPGKASFDLMMILKNACGTVKTFRGLDIREKLDKGLLNYYTSFIHGGELEIPDSVTFDPQLASTPRWWKNAFELISGLVSVETSHVPTPDNTRVSDYRCNMFWHYACLCCLCTDKPKLRPIQYQRVVTLRRLEAGLPPEYSDTEPLLKE